MALKKNPNYKQDAEEFYRQCERENKQDLANLTRDLIKGAKKPLKRLENLLDSDNENVALNASLGYLKLIGLEKQQVVHSGQVEFKPWVISNE